MRKSWWVFVFLGLPLTAFAGKEHSALMACYKASETHVEVTACLDNHWKVAQEALNKTEIALGAHLKKLDEVSSATDAVPISQSAFDGFQYWRENQCKMVEASFASGSGSGQGYLNCMIELTNEQIIRLNSLMGVKGGAK
ncbi:lysozyme inhibitor LprI family protein [Grimontia marina]|uniref:Lysozyme inhibitor LprI-like N-terminal domain-containing protein n=1 Tax=Grimontia marina TaxID=646534 RepID=A0A128FFD9_9GAMM|nr:lysozyme inhibitor LprI family protein [Grimontia marina]CZF85509.1 hypothetical protein GMA8713_03562 [Grimontia marina]